MHPFKVPGMKRDSVALFQGGLTLENRGPPRHFLENKDSKI